MKCFLKSSIALLGVMLLSMCNFLDIVPDKMGTLDYAFGDRNRAHGYLGTVYSFLPRFDNVNSNPGRSVGPEHIQNLHEMHLWSNGNRITANGNSYSIPLMNFWDGVNIGTMDKSMFTAIRCCDILIENVWRVPDLATSEKLMWEAEAKFLKAFYHWWLVQLYGPIPTTRQSLPIDATTEQVMVFRDPLDVTLDFIIELIDEAIEHLPDQVSFDIEDLGRITKPIAMAVKAKILTHYASPFYNGNEGYANFVCKKNGYRFFPDYDANKWVIAKDAALEAIIELEKLGHKLYVFDENEEGVLLMNDSVRTKLRWQGAVTKPWNSELIWGYTTVDGPSNSYQSLSRAPNSGTLGQSRFAPTMSTVETFYSSNGIPIEEDKDWVENNTWFIDRYRHAEVDESHRFYLVLNEETAILHFNREPRFYGSLQFDRSLWFAQAGGLAMDINNQVAVRSRFGTAGGGHNKTSTERYSVTGYHPSKLASWRTANPASNAPHYVWPIMRLADLYLLYAEALNETIPDGGDRSEVYKYVNRVRNAGGLKDVQDSWENYAIDAFKEKYKSRDGMRDIIHQERMNELAFEGHYYFDIKRWSGRFPRARYDIMNLMNNPIRGWNVDGSSAVEYYNVVNIILPSFTFRDYLWPISERNLIQNANLTPQPGWGM